MEAIGDSPLIEGKQSTEMKDSVEFERNLDNFGVMLDAEEKRLVELDEMRLKMQAEIEGMFAEIMEEKRLHREAIDCIIRERDRLANGLLEEQFSPATLEPIESSMSLFEACRKEIESTKSLDLNIELDIEKIRCELLDSYISTKESYLSTMKDHLNDKKKRLESKMSEGSQELTMSDD